jgi:hypothetical protein
MAAPQQYYLRSLGGKVIGPFSGAELKTMAGAGRLDLSWQISADQVNWCTVAKAKNLFGSLETALSEHVHAGGQYRSLTRQEVVALFLDKFILNNENFRDSFPFLQTVRVWWAKLTLPGNFVITEVTAAGVHHVKYNMGTGESRAIDQREAERNVADGVRRFNWFMLLAAMLGVVWLYWTVRGFVTDFSLTWGTLKTVFMGAIALAGFVFKTKNSKVFVGYTLDPSAVRRLQEIAEAVSALRACSQVWMYCLQQNLGRLNWKYNAGDTFTVARLPLAIFNRTIPNVETNVRVNGIAYGSQAVYFLPERILVIDGSVIRNVPYGDLQVEVDSLEYVETEAHVYRDSDVIGHRWKFINRDGSRDRRFNGNYELPVVRCGILLLGVGETHLTMMTTNPVAPDAFRRRINMLRTSLP